MTFTPDDLGRETSPLYCKSWPSWPYRAAKANGKHRNGRNNEWREAQRGRIGENDRRPVHNAGTINMGGQGKDPSNGPAYNAGKGGPMALPTALFNCGSSSGLSRRIVNRGLLAGSGEKFLGYVFLVKPPVEILLFVYEFLEIRVNHGAPKLWILQCIQKVERMGISGVQKTIRTSALDRKGDRTNSCTNERVNRFSSDRDAHYILGIFRFLPIQKVLEIVHERRIFEISVLCEVYRLL